MLSEIFSSGSEARLGSLGILPFIPVPALPNIIAEWAAILPLVCHLATQRDDYLTTGDIALRGRLCVGVFPRLGTLSGLGRLLGRKNKYLDSASIRAGSSRTVWDIKWGSAFPCANGAACAAITRYLRSQGQASAPPLRMPERLSPPERPPQLPQLSFEKPSLRSNISRISSCGDSGANRPKKDDGVRRNQVLHVYKLGYCGQKRPSLRRRLDRIGLSVPGRILWSSLLLALAVFFALFGSYGTSVLVLCTSVSELVAQGVTIRRPSTYLKNTEAHDACMLVASHQNATEWHLFIGDRGVVDTLLNKPMFVLPDERSASVFAAAWFWVANLLQFAAMTFVAAQKGWDGVSMVVLLAVHWALRWFPHGDQYLASNWVEREGIGAHVRSFEFTGRTAMMGAIQILAGNACTRWMDDILVPHARREAWLKCLRGETLTEKLEPRDALWLDFALEGSLAAANVLMQTFGISDGRCPLYINPLSAISVTRVPETARL
ncbi:hypothetical protein F5B17DRAFT_38908 [Nemania serpens]|nr:hypothetical protein F5B17DRAFT_38908 [Nemania serpens]